jgi:hypothetical protein
VRFAVLSTAKCAGHSELQFGTWLTLDLGLTAFLRCDALIDCVAHVRTDARTTLAN